MLSVMVGPNQDAVIEVESVGVDKVVDDQEVLLLAVRDDAHALHVVVLFARGVDTLHQETVLAIKPVRDELAFGVDLVDDDVCVVLPRGREDHQLKLLAHSVQKFCQIRSEIDTNFLGDYSLRLSLNAERDSPFQKQSHMSSRT